MRSFASKVGKRSEFSPDSCHIYVTGMASSLEIPNTLGE